MPPGENGASLRASEWILAGCLFCILLSLFAIAKFQVWHCTKGTDTTTISLVKVKIEGFVERPNVYEFALGTPLEEALRKARPKRFADLRSIDQASVLTTSIQLNIEKLSSLKVHITGAVAKSETIEVAPGTRICQLKQKIVLIEESDLAFFKKRRFLSDGEVVDVPYK
jgi:hypothetical protein